jgi:lipopolysaccharide transport protein LptA
MIFVACFAAGISLFAASGKDGKGKTASLSSGGKRSVTIVSDRTDYDRKQGVILFDGNVFVNDNEYKMHSDTLYVFLDGTNDLKRIVACGDVCITNGLRVGTCQRAVYSRLSSRIVMYGNSSANAKLVDNGKRKSELEGEKITFWVDSEQVAVEKSKVTIDASGSDMKNEMKRLRNGKK